MIYKLGIIFAFVFSALLMIVGALFKIMHWPYATLLLITGQLLILIAFVFLLVKWTKKRPVNNNLHTN
jgi:hypothetical protein